jgi:DNA-binding response OmpR family regulator
MIKRVLIVDDDMEMLVSLKDGLSRYEETFSVLTALDGLMATQELKRINISLVVTDLKMPNLDGFSLLSHIMEHYPEIPVLIITGYSTPEMERMAREGGAVGYIAKPFTIEDLARRIVTTLRKEADGGTLHSVSSAIFLQLMEMEERTCTIRLFEKTGGRRGILFFRDGELLDAKTGGLRGEAAAYEVFSWDEVSLNIQNSCQQKTKRIKKDLQAILLEAMRRKDERRHQDEAVPSLAEEEDSGLDLVEAEEEPSAIEQLMDVISKEFEQGSGVEDIYYDDSWRGLVDGINTLGEVFEGGELRAGYLDRGESRDFILVPREKVIVISVNPRCPRDRIMELLGAQEN